MFHFKKHYTIEEARALLPKIREWLEQLEQFQRRIDQAEQRVNNVLSAGQDAGGDSVNNLMRHVAGMKAVLAEFQQREIQIKDVERGLVDFPALRDGKEIFLCWEKDEEDIEHWHDLDSGYAGREPL